MARLELAAGLLIALCACGDALSEHNLTQASAPDAATTLPWPRTPFPERDAASEPPEVLAARAELGRLLFYDPVLSADRQTACASCHSEIWGMGDGLPRSVGHGGGLLSGPGRSGGAVLRRNAPQLWNLTFRANLFWDGRTRTLEEQALAPLRSKEELDRAPEEVARELATFDGYLSLFAHAFPDDPAPSVPHLASAIAEFERGLISSRALYDGYADGDAYALTETQVEGMFRFAELGCHECHTPPLFEGAGFYDRHLPTTPGVDDAGRFEVTHNAPDRRAFRVPSLRNVAFSAPYFHDGSVHELQDAVRHELEQSGRAFDHRDLEAVTSFISDALKDETREPARPRSLPSGLPVPVDGTFVSRF